MGSTYQKSNDSQITTRMPTNGTNSKVWLPYIIPPEARPRTHPTPGSKYGVISTIRYPYVAPDTPPIRRSPACLRFT